MRTYWRRANGLNSGTAEDEFSAGHCEMISCKLYPRLYLHWSVGRAHKNRDYTEKSA